PGATSASGAQPATGLLVRTFKVDPNTFYQGLEAVVGNGALNASASNRGNNSPASVNIDVEKVNLAVKTYLTSLGGDLNPNLCKTVFWHDRAGELLVRATAQDLSLIEAAIGLLNKTPQQINIKARFVEVDADDKFNSLLFGAGWPTNFPGTEMIS